MDLSGQESRTGRLLLEEVNEGSQEVYFDSLTITHPQDRGVVSQENHYYPFGMALSGVAVNTTPVIDLSKEQFNQGSMLQDELLGAEAGIYSTFYRSYDPTTGRFTGVDPLADEYTNQSPYQFGNNDPINFNDPTGALSQAEFSGGREINPRGMDGQRHSTLNDLEFFMYETSGGGGGGGGGSGRYDWIKNIASLDIKRGIVWLKVFASSNNLIADNAGNFYVTDVDNHYTVEPHDLSEFLNIKQPAMLLNLTFTEAAPDLVSAVSIINSLFDTASGATLLNAAHRLDGLAKTVPLATAIISPLLTAASAKIEYSSNLADTHTLVNIGLGVVGTTIAVGGFMAAAATAPVWGVAGVVFGVGTLIYNSANYFTEGSIDSAIDNATNHFGKRFFYGK